MHKSYLSLAVLRLPILFTIFCLWSVFAGLHWRTLQQSPGALDSALVPDNAPATQLPFLGITVELQEQTAVQQRARLARLRQEGFGWVRQRFDWEQIEPTPGQFDWRASDVLIESLSSSGLIPVIVLDGSPAWARTPQDIAPTTNPFAPPADNQTFAHFVGEFARRYGEHLRFYQIWDEPNIAPHWGNRHSEPLGYAQLLRVASRAIRSVDPDAVIITAALAPTRDRGHLAIDEVYFLQRLYAAGSAADFDAVAIQPFGFGDSPTYLRQAIDVLNFQRAALIRRTMVAAGDGETPLWAVRYGWNRQINSPWATVTGVHQQQFAQEAVSLARQQWPWLVALGWVIDEPDAPSDDPRWGFVLDAETRSKLTQAARGEIMLADSKDVEAKRTSGWLTVTLILAPFLIIWRAAAALLRLPWQRWQRRYLDLPALIRIGIWVGLLLIYYFATWQPLILLCWIGATLLIMARPLHGLWLVAVTLPFYFQHKEIHLVDATLTVAPALAATLCLIPAILQAARRSWRAVTLTSASSVEPSPCHLVILSWLMINLFSATNVWHWPAYGRGLLEFAIAPLLLWLALGLFAVEEKARRGVVLALFGGGVLAASLGLWGWLGGVGVEADGVLRLTGPYFSPNHMALYLVRTFFLGVGLLIGETDGVGSSARIIPESNNRFRDYSGNPVLRRGVGGRWELVVSISLVLMALLLTTSRGALLLGVPVGTAVLLWSGWREGVWFNRIAQFKTSGWILVIGTGIVLVTLGLILGWERLGNSATVTERLATWAATLRLWRDFPLFGVGPGGFFWRYPAYWVTGIESDPNLRHPHNVWLEMGAGWGGAGLLWLCWVGWKVLKMGVTIVKQKQPVSWVEIGCLAGLVAGLAHAQVDAFMALPDLALWNWMILALLFASQLERLIHRHKPGAGVSI